MNQPRVVRSFKTLFLSVSLFGLVSLPGVAQETDPKNLPLEDIQRFSTAIGQIKNYYVEQVDDETLFENAIRGMLTGLDPHSAYLDIEEYSDLKSHTNGEFGGLGIEVGMEDGFIRVVSPIDDTPASRAGIKPGDVIVKLDDKPVKGMTLRDAVSLMRGKKGTSLDLTIIRKNEKKVLQFTLIREVIRIKSVKNKLLEDGYGYIRISHFQSPTSETLKKSINTLREKSHGKLKGLVLDLRNNPGGLLDSAIEVSDVFLDSNQLSGDKLIVYTKGRINGSSMKASATPGDLSENIPLVVLINEGSASGSEIVAGALQDHQRAVIMGTPSFGKGSVQTVLPLDEKRGVKLTTALYYTPNGRSIQAKGILPDIEVKDMEVAHNTENDNLLLAMLKEADLENHLDNGNAKEAASNQANGNADASSDSTIPLAVSDYQLHEALNLLKAMNVVSKR